MKDLAPHIYRQRIVIEGLFTQRPSEASLSDYIYGLSKMLKMTILFGPIVKNLTAGTKFNAKHAGLEAVAIWAESGVQVYIWDNASFFTVDIYTCAPFSSEAAIDYTKTFFKASEIVFKPV